MTSCRLDLRGPGETPTHGLTQGSECGTGAPAVALVRPCWTGPVLEGAPDSSEHRPEADCGGLVGGVRVFDF